MVLFGNCMDPWKIAKSSVTISLSPQGRAYTRALKIEKSLSPPIPVGGGGGRGA